MKELIIFLLAIWIPFFIWQISGSMGIGIIAYNIINIIGWFSWQNESYKNNK